MKHEREFQEHFSDKRQFECKRRYHFSLGDEGQTRNTLALSRGHSRVAPKHQLAGSRRVLVA
jgi:hypothetical protein